MKSKGLIIVGLTALALIMAAGCASSKSPTSGRAASNSEIVVRRIDGNASMRIRVYIDGKQVGALRIGESHTYKVKNGDHTIFVNSDTYADREPRVLEFTSYQTRHVFAVTDHHNGTIMPMSGGPENLDQEITSHGLETAVTTAFDIVTRDLKNKAKIAIINVASDNQGEGIFVIEEMTYLAVHTRKKFVVIDRRKIEAIRIEKYFDKTTSYEDDFLVSIGHLLGAEVVITGNLNGSGGLRRLRIKALDVKSGQLISMASEPV